MFKVPINFVDIWHIPRDFMWTIKHEAFDHVAFQTVTFLAFNFVELCPKNVFPIRTCVGDEMTGFPSSYVILL